MKRLLSLALVALMGLGIASAADRIVYNDTPLPATAKQVLKSNFKSQVNFVKVDKNLLGGIDDYEVVLKNGTEVEFDSNGNLKSVEAGANGVPSGLILPSIQQYVNKNYKGKKIVQLDVEKNYYEVELSGGIELKFDRAGKFLSVNY